MELNELCAVLHNPLAGTQQVLAHIVAFLTYILDDRHRFGWFSGPAVVNIGFIML